MAREIRVDALALECGVPVARVMELLVELGQLRVRRVSQHIPAALARQVRRRLSAAPVSAAAPTLAAEEVDLFAQAMSEAGVRPLGGNGRAAKAKRPRALKAAPSPAAPAPIATASPVQAPAPTPPPSPKAPAPPAPPAPAPAPESASPSEGKDGEEIQARITALEAQLVEECAQREALDEAHHRALLELSSLREALGATEALAERLQGHAAAAQGQRSVVDALKQRGLVGLDEANIALRSLLAAHLLDGLLPFLVTPDADRLARTLDERLCLCCGQQGCGIPSGVERVAVPAARCELCGGFEIGPLFRRFSDACLLAGLTKILLVGGRRWSSAWLEGRFDRRVSLRALPGDLPVRAEVVGSDLAWAELAVIWEAPPLGEELAAAVQERLPRATLRVSGGSMGAALDAAAGAIESFDPVSLFEG